MGTISVIGRIVLADDNRRRGLRRRLLQRARPYGVAAPILVFAALASLSGCAADTIQGRSSTPLLSYDVASRTAEVQLLAAETMENGGFNFDGASGGALTLTVPKGWVVDVTCINYSTTLSHSCAIVEDGSSRTAFPGAQVPNPRRGLEPSRSGNFSFVAERAGHFQIVCLVTGHREQGMWDRFVVRRGGRPFLVGAVAIAP